METRTVTCSTASTNACTATSRTIQIHRPQERPQRRRRRCNSKAQRYTWILLSSSYCCYISAASASEAYQQYTHHQHHQLHATSQCVLPVQQLERCDEYQPLGYSFLYHPRGGSSSSSSSGELEDKELDAYIESLIATVDDTTSEAEDVLLEVQVSVPQSNDQRPDESSLLVDGDKSNKPDVTETLQTTVDNIPMERNNPVIGDEEEEEEGFEKDDEEDEDEVNILVERNNLVTGEDEDEEEDEDVENDDEEEDEVDIPMKRNNPVIEDEEEEKEDDDVENDEEEDEVDIPVGRNNPVIEDEEEEDEDVENDDEEEDEVDIPMERNNPVIEDEEEEEEDEDVENDDEEIDEEEEEEEEVSEIPTTVEGKQQDGGEADDESDNDLEEEEDISEASTAENDVIKRNQGIEKRHEDDSEKPADMEEDAVVTNPNDPALAHTSTENDMQRDSSKETMARPRPQPPNPVYLFLLRRGTVGHVLAMGLVLVVELIQTYLPSLARFLAWLWFRLAPARLQKGAALPRRRRRPNPPTLATVRNPRTAQSGKLRKKLTQQADQQALAQLKRAGSVGDARYRYVSTHFLQRHGLGPFADATSSSSSTTTDDSPLQTGPSKTQDDAEEEDDVDWVVQALAKDKKDYQSKKSSWQPTVSVGVGSGGPSFSVGVEFGVGKESKDRRSSIIKAAATSTVARKKRKVTRASDRDGGSGVVGRIRAVTGANSRVSRSLFGAYPGDAVSLEDAASTKGVVELARKYGYGDWSEDDDDRDDEGEVGGKHRRLKSRRKRQHHSRPNHTGDDSRHSSSNTISAEWKSSSSSGKKSRRKHTRRSGSFSKTEDPDTSGRNGSMTSHHSSRSSAHRVRPNHPLASSSVLGKKPGSYRAADLAKATTIRPAMERVRHVRQNAASKRLKEDNKN